VLLKMGGYAMMRVTWPIFPEAAALFWYPVGALGVFAIIYGALCAMAQTDWKKLVAYSSVSHMGYVTLGIAAMTRTGWDGAYYQMIGHGIVSPMMFFMVGVVYERAHHREINRFGGLWLRWPRYGAWSLICFFAGLGLPGMAGFIGEVMALLGAFDAAGSEALIKATGLTAAAHRSQVYALGSLAAFGVVLTAGYILWMFQRVYMGKDKPEYDEYAPPSQLEYGIMTTLGIAAIVFGIVPWLVFGLTDQTFSKLAASLGLAM
jgi:NADH-quinone oxidoreductase subunit M